jgi:HK97 gp10 family phage protein
MGRVVVKRNDLPAIIAALPRAIDDGVDETANDMATELKGTLWVDTGLIRRVTVDKPEGVLHAEIWIGYNRGHGFYSRFQEWGTVKQAARPIVGPTAHRYEGIYAKNMARAVKRACNAR